MVNVYVAQGNDERVCHNIITRIVSWNGFEVCSIKSLMVHVCFGYKIKIYREGK